MPSVPLPPEPLVSIIIPCHNAKAFITAAIESALAQTWPHTEVVVVDDGSQDDTLQVIRSYGDRIRWHAQPNAGGCAARNRGVELATGEYIQFLDADDLLTPEAVASKVARLDPARPRLVPCSTLTVDETRGIPARQVGPSSWFEKDFDLAKFFSSGSPQTAAPLHRKENLRKVGGFRVGLTCCQEHDLHLRLAVELGLEFEARDPVGVVIRPETGSVSRTAGVRMSVNGAFVILDVLPKMEARGLLTPPVRRAAALSLGVLARRCWAGGAREEAVEAARTATLLDPFWLSAQYPNPLLRCGVKVLGWERFNRLRNRLPRRSRK